MLTMNSTESVWVSLFLHPGNIANIETDTFLNNSQTQTTTCFYFIPHIEKM
jgi:hypothetical protein